MTRLLTSIAMSAAIFMAAQALAVDAGDKSATAKRQLIARVSSCMTRRMSVNRAISYNEAMRVCKDKLLKPIDGSASGALLASATPSYP
ncbi:MAG: hypothetical protein ACLQJ0_11100 [Steroidobacteraceae bacterium]|jgi:hypothetical protein